MTTTKKTIWLETKKHKREAGGKILSVYITSAYIEGKWSKITLRAGNNLEEILGIESGEELREFFEVLNSHIGKMKLVENPLVEAVAVLDE